MTMFFFFCKLHTTNKATLTVLVRIAEQRAKKFGSDLDCECSERGGEGGKKKRKKENCLQLWLGYKKSASFCAKNNSVRCFCFFSLPL